MKKNKQSKKLPNAKVMLHARVLLRDQQGKIFDVTNAECGYGLRSLEQMGSTAVEDLIRVEELLGVLALAAENRPKIDAHLVLRILEEVGVILDESGELASYVRSTQELFEEAEGLPPVSGPDKRKGGRTLTLVKSAS
ncbi:MAG: hypothetical protein H8K03_14400 [Nitrospira sp.]